MSWTDATTLKLHLQALSVDSLAVRFTPVVLTGTDDVHLPHGNLVDGSVKAHAFLQSHPAGPVALTLNGTSWYASGYSAVLPGSVVLAPADPPMERYVEGVDYAVEDETARVRRIDGGAVASGAQVLLWLLPLTELDRDVDFTVNLAAGTVARIATGGLPDPARIVLSYTTSAAGASDTLIGQTIHEAEAKILDRLRDGYDASSTEDGLVTGATELTLSHLCDDLALRALAAVGDASADNRARRFMELALRYRERAATTLSRYLKQPLPSAPSLQSNTARSTW